MEVDIHLPFSCCFPKQDICSATHNNRLFKALIYFPLTYTFDKKGRDKLFADLKRAALVEGD